MRRLISFRHTGSFSHTIKLLNNINNRTYLSILDRYGQMGVEALSSATPVRTGATASSWTYEVEQSNGQMSIVWSNNHQNKGVNIAVILQYGHGTRNGGYVRGIDYINPAIQPIFEEIANSVWKEVTET